MERRDFSEFDQEDFAYLVDLCESLDPSFGFTILSLEAAFASDAPVQLVQLFPISWLIFFCFLCFNLFLDTIILSQTN